MQTAITRTSGPGRVLLVDDHPAVRRVLRSLLEEVGGWQVVGEADFGEAAIPLVEQLAPDVVLMDCRSPVLRAEGVMATDLVAEVVDDWRLAEPDRRVELSLPDRPRSLQGDAEALRMVVGNLVDNAGKHAPPGTPISVEVSQSAGLTRIEVADRGEGVAEIDRERIFAPFTQLDASTTRRVGSASACSWSTGWSGAWAAGSGWRTTRAAAPASWSSCPTWPRCRPWPGRRRAGLSAGPVRDALEAPGQLPHREGTAVPDVEPTPASYQRSPVDVLRLVVAAVAFLFCLVLAVGAENTMVGVEADLLQLADRVPSALAAFLVGLVQVVALVAPLVVIAVALVLRRFRLGLLLVAVPVAAAVLEGVLVSRLDRIHPQLLERALAQESWIGGATFPSSGWICGAAAAATVASPWLTHGMRRAAWWLVGVFAVIRMVTGHEVPLDVLAGIALGAAVGSAGLLVAGRPSLRPDGPQLVGALARSGFEVKSLERAGVDARGSTPYFATLDDGRRLFVKALGQDERDADLLFRAWRRLRLQNVGDELPYSTLRRAVEHEALVSLKAADAGVRTPHLVTVAAVGELAMVLAYDAVDGRSLDEVDAGAIADDMLWEIWEQVAELRRQRIAHRDLRLANVLLDPDGHPWVIDFGFAELAAGDDLLDEDAAELLSSTYTMVGAERAVAAATDVLGSGPVASALRYVQPAALSTATRRAVNALPGKDKPLQAEILRVTGVAEPQYAQVERVSLRRVAVWLFTGVAVYFLIHQLSDVQLLAQQVRQVDWRWLPAIVAMSVLSYAAAAMSAIGSVPDRLPPWPTFVAQVGASFVNWVTPAKVGGLALGARFMERQGVHAAVAVTGAGINAGAGAVMHAALLGVFAVAVGVRGVNGLHPPSARTLPWVGLGILAVSGLVAAVPAGRRLVYRHVAPSLERAVHGTRELAGHPGKLALLFGGSALVTLCYAFGLVYCVEAFGGGLTVPAIIAAYLVGAAIAQVAPTPGGIGAVEAALIAALTAAGLDKETAVPAVFLFRLITFWLPILPGWLAFAWLQRSDRI